MCISCHDTGVLHDEHRNPEAFCDCELGVKLDKCYPLPTETCDYCNNTGTVYDSVDYGSTTVSMPSNCDCALGVRLWALEEPEEALQECFDADLYDVVQA